MNRKGPVLLALAVLVLAGSVVAAVVVAGNDDGTSEVESTLATSDAAEPAPSLDIPSAASAAEQAAVQQEVIEGVTQDGLLRALRNPLVVSPNDVAVGPSTAAPPASTGGRTTTVDPTVPSAQSGASTAARRCVQPPKVSERRGYAFDRDCFRESYGDFPASVMGVLNFCVKDRSCWNRPKEWKVCSATVTSTETDDGPGNESVLVTAGHCVGQFERGSWNVWTRAFWLPSPQVEESATRPFTLKGFRRWVADNAWFPQFYAGTQTPVAYVPGAWKSGSGWRYDFAAVVMKGRESSILAALGGVGIDMTGAGVNQPVLAYGYPAGSPFDGTRLFVCSAKAVLGDRIFDNPATLGIGCDMTGGSSGGPWIRETDPSSAIVSVNSYGPRPPRRNENVMFGPNLNGDHWPTFVAARNHPT